MAKILKTFPSLAFFFLISLPSLAQLVSPPEWSIGLSENDLAVGDEVELVFRAKIPATWYIYSNDFDPDLGPLLTELILEDSTGLELKEGLRAIDPKTKYEDVWEGDVTYFEGEGEFRQSFVVTEDEIRLAGMVTYQMCSDITGQCVNYEEDFDIEVKASVAVTPDQPAEAAEGEKLEPIAKKDATAITDEPGEAVEAVIPSGGDEDIETQEDKVSPTEEGSPVSGESDPSREETGKTSMIGFMILAFLGGLAALLTPCVFPMIPMTVTFFTGRAKSRVQGIRNAMIYGLSIIGIYT